MREREKRLRGRDGQTERLNSHTDNSVEGQSELHPHLPMHGIEEYCDQLASRMKRNVWPGNQTSG